MKFIGDFRDHIEPGKPFDFEVNRRAGRVQYLINGVVVHEDVELTGPTLASTFHDEQPAGPLMLQGDHGPVAYRNIWLRDVSGPAN